MVILHAARRRLPVPPLARWMLALGIAASLAVNVAQGWSHGLVGAAAAAWPAVALVGSYELLAWMIRTAAPSGPGHVPGRSTAYRDCSRLTRSPRYVGQHQSDQDVRARRTEGTKQAEQPGNPDQVDRVGRQPPGTAAAGAVFTVPHVAQVRFYLASAPRGRYPTPCHEALYRRMSIGLPVPTCFDTLLEAKLDADASRDLIMQTAQTIGPARDDDSPPRGQPGRRNSQDAAVIQRQLRSYYERLRPHR